MPALPGLESVAKSKIKDGKANALRRSKTLTREMAAKRARNVVGDRIRGKLFTSESTQSRTAKRLTKCCVVRNISPLSNYHIETSCAVNSRILKSKCMCSDDYSSFPSSLSPLLFFPHRSPINPKFLLSLLLLSFFSPFFSLYTVFIFTKKQANLFVNIHLSN
jgi:hypothetical protein